jgi:hypothetical protein
MESWNIPSHLQCIIDSVRFMHLESLGSKKTIDAHCYHDAATAEGSHGVSWLVKTESFNMVASA